MPNPVVHFEIPADDPPRAIAFYEKVFGWGIKRLPMPPGGPEYYGVTTRREGDSGINGGLMKRNMPGQPFANYVAVSSIDDFLARVQAHGGSVVMPKQEIAPGMGSFAMFNDTEGNMMGLYQPAAAPAKKASARKPTKTKAKKKRR